MFAMIVGALIAIALGVAFCIWGYRLFLVMLPIWGFFAGFWVGAQAIALLFGDGFLATLLGWGAGFFGGLLFAVLSYLFYMVGVAVIAAGFGAALASGLLSAFGLGDGFLGTIIIVAVAVILALLVLIFNVQKYVIIAITSLGGANLVVAGVLLFLGRITLESLAEAGSTIRPIVQDSWLWLIVWLVIAGVGIVGQLRTSRDFVFNKERYAEGWG